MDLGPSTGPSPGPTSSTPSDETTTKFENIQKFYTMAENLSIYSPNVAHSTIGFSHYQVSR